MMQKKQLNIIISFMLAAMLFSCEEPFSPDIDIKEYESMLVVEGLITNETGPFRVRLTSSVPLDTTVNKVPVNGAIVEILDTHGKTYILNGISDGWYETFEKNLQAEEGVGYTLNVTTPDGMHYESSTVEMVKGPEIEDIYFEESYYTDYSGIKPREERWLDILIDAKGDDGETSYVKWEYEETWEIKIPNDVKVANSYGFIYDEVVKPNDEMRHCWVTSKSNTIKVASTEQQDVNNIQGFLLKSIGPGGNQLHLKYSILVKQYSMNKELFTFWNKLKDSNENIGSMFDKIPSAVYGNITCCSDNKNSLGYFMVSDVQKKRIFIAKPEHRVRTFTGYEDCLYAYQPLPGYVYFGETEDNGIPIYNTAPQCIDCLNEGTNVKPPFWE
jgi:hypothetical protein